MPPGRAAASACLCSVCAALPPVPCPLSNTSPRFQPGSRDPWCKALRGRSPRRTWRDYTATVASPSVTPMDLSFRPRTRRRQRRTWHVAPRSWLALALAILIPVHAGVAAVERLARPAHVHRSTSADRLPIRHEHERAHTRARAHRDDHGHARSDDHDHHHATVGRHHHDALDTSVVVIESPADGVAGKRLAPGLDAVMPQRIPIYLRRQPVAPPVMPPIAFDSRATSPPERPPR